MVEVAVRLGPKLQPNAAVSKLQRPVLACEPPVRRAAAAGSRLGIRAPVSSLVLKAAPYRLRQRNEARTGRASRLLKS